MIKLRNVPKETLINWGLEMYVNRAKHCEDRISFFIDIKDFKKVQLSVSMLYGRPPLKMPYPYKGQLFNCQITSCDVYLFDN